MDKRDFEIQRKAVLDCLLLGRFRVVAGKMFGYPAYYINRKLFACIYGKGVGVKIPAELAKELLSRQRVVPFQPWGKPQMREWVQINRPTAADYQNDIDIFRASIEFVRQLNNRERKR
jgi:hypothetical protein